MKRLADTLYDLLNAALCIVACLAFAQALMLVIAIQFR